MIPNRFADLCTDLCEGLQRCGAPSWGVDLARDLLQGGGSSSLLMAFGGDVLADAAIRVGDTPDTPPSSKDLSGVTWTRVPTLAAAAWLARPDESADLDPWRCEAGAALATQAGLPCPARAPVACASDWAGKALQAAATLEGPARGQLHLRALSWLHDAPQPAWDRMPGESSGGALHAILMHRCLDVLAGGIATAARRNATADIAGFIAARCQDETEAAWWTEAGQWLRAHASGIAAHWPIAAALGRRDWANASELAVARASSSQDATLALGWTVLHAMWTLRATEDPSDQAAALQRVKARTSAVRPAPSAVRAWVQETLPGILVRRRQWDLAAQEAWLPLDHPLAAWMNERAAWSEAPSEAGQQRWVARWLQLGLPEDASAGLRAWTDAVVSTALAGAPPAPPSGSPVDDDVAEARSLHAEMRDAGMVADVWATKVLDTEAQQRLAKSRARWRDARMPPALAASIPALRSRSWEQARASLTGTRLRGWPSGVLAALVDVADAEPGEALRMVTAMLDGTTPSDGLHRVLQQLGGRADADSLLPGLLLLPTHRLDARTRQAWRDALLSLARQLPAARVAALARGTSLSDPERMGALARAIAERGDSNARATLMSLADSAPEAARAVVLTVLLDATPTPAERGAIAQAVLNVDARNTTALHTLIELAESRSEWDDAVRWRERLGRGTPNAAERAVQYLRIAELLDTRLDNPGGALENAIVSFICDPTSAATLSLLERLYKAQKKYRDLVATYDSVLDELRKPEDAERASDLWARKAQVQFQALQQPTEAAKSLLEAIRLRPQSRKLVDLMVNGVAPRAGAQWAEQAQALHRAAVATPSVQRAESGSE